MAKHKQCREMLDELEWPSLEARRDLSSLLLFHKIHSGAVSIEKDKYLTAAHSLNSTTSNLVRQPDQICSNPFC